MLDGARWVLSALALMASLWAMLAADRRLIAAAFLAHGVNAVAWTWVQSEPGMASASGRVVSGVTRTFTFDSGPWDEFVVGASGIDLCQEPRATIVEIRCEPDARGHAVLGRDFARVRPDASEASALVWHCLGSRVTVLRPGAWTVLARKLGSDWKDARVGWILSGQARPWMVALSVLMAGAVAARGLLRQRSSQ